MHTRQLRIVLCVLLAGGATNARAVNEDFFDLSLDDLSKLKVTAASAFAESALDSSATVSVVQRADWERRGARDLPDAVMHLPDVMLLQPPAGGKLIQVRSYDSSSLRGRATLVDGVPINTFAFGSEVFSNAELQLPVLDSLELVRGPSSILYGSDAFHSALLLSTYHNPLQQFEVAGAVGDHDYHQLAVRGTQPIGDDQSLQMAVSGTHQGDQGLDYTYRTLAGTSAPASRAQSHNAASGLFRWEGEAGKVGHSLELFVDKTDAEELAGGGSAVGNVRNFDIADHNAELWMLKGQLEGDLGAGWGWRWDAYYWRNDYGQSFVLPASATGLAEDRQQFLEHRAATSFRITQSDLKWLATRTQFALTAGTEKAGIDDHKNQRISMTGGFVPQPTLDYSGLDQSIDNLSFEGKTRWRDDHWQVIYGGRYDDYSTFGSQTSPRLGLIWIPTNDYSIKALYGKAFRAPNANELRGTNFFSGDADLKPETLDSYELAFAIARGNFHLELIGFDSKWHDRIILKADPTAMRGRRYANVGESEAKGIETALTYVADQWRAELSASKISNKNLDTHQESSVFPEWILNFGAGYTWPASKLEFFVNNRLHQNVKVGDQAISATPLDDAGLFFRTDISLKQQWTPAWSGQVVVRNLFDRNNIWPAVVNNPGGVVDISRQFAIEITYRAP